MPVWTAERNSLQELINFDNGAEMKDKHEQLRQARDGTARTAVKRVRATPIGSLFRRRLESRRACSPIGIPASRETK